MTVTKKDGIKVVINGKIFTANQNSLLSEVLLENGFITPHPCGGKGVCQKCKVKVNGRAELSCKYVITSDVNVELEVKNNILSQSGAEILQDGGKEDFELVLDLGTTTLAMASISKKEKKILQVIHSNNPQTAFGADVISRQEYAKTKGVSKMSQLVRAEISRMIHTFGKDGVEVLHVSGNTTMLHILLGVDPSQMGVYPYTPVFLDEKYIDGCEMGIDGVKTLHILPSVSAFVGADLVAGANYIGSPTEKKYSLLVDLGTNAEILLISKDEILATAAAAGPCFEGGCISCGMSAVDGAVYEFGDNGVKTVGDCEPKGVCGTGLVDVIAHLIRENVMDKSGYIKEPFEVCENVVITQGDIRQYQLAKSAIVSAILTLIKQSKADASQIQALYIAGGFSAKINADNAALTGLFPKELKDVCMPVGNSSLLGTAKAVFDGDDLNEIVRRSTFLDLSTNIYFSEQFLKNMDF